MADVTEDLLDYEEEEETIQPNSGVQVFQGPHSKKQGVNPDGRADGSTDGEVKEAKKGSYVGVHATGFRDFLLKPELLRAIVDCGFEHPSEVQQECIPQAILGMDVLCQAKSGMGKTAVFVLATLQQLEPGTQGYPTVIVLCHTRELAYQIRNEFARFSKYMPYVKTAVMYGGTTIKQQRETLQSEKPQFIVGTPGRVLALLRTKMISLKNVKHFVLDECDKMLEQLDMRRDVQEIFKSTPHQKQVMMYSATLSKEIRPICKKFMQNPLEIYVDDETKLTLHGLHQYYVKLAENAKNRKLNDLLDNLEFNQVCIFVKSAQRASELNKLLNECNFPSICIHSQLPQEERIARYKSFKSFGKRIMVSTDIFGRGIDIERVNIVINYDMPDSPDTYLHRVGRAGRFGTKGLAITFVSSQEDSDVLNAVQGRFEVNITELPPKVEVSAYRYSTNVALRGTTALSIRRNIVVVAAVRAYHQKVLEHYENPRNVGSLDKDDPNVGTALVGSPACGDVMKLQILVDEKTGIISDAKFKTFGCGSAIASSSYATTLLKGMTIEEASKVEDKAIAQHLSLPPVKLHCSMLAEDAVKFAIKDWASKKEHRKTPQ